MGVLAYWVHDLDPFLIRFPEGFFVEGVRWYGVAYALGFLIAAVLLHVYFRRGRSPLSPDDQGNYLIVLILGVLVGGRLGYLLLYDFENFIRAPWRIVDFSSGGISGMASHGGFVGVILALLLFARFKKIDPWRLGDLTVTLVPPGILLGRLANFINGELWGKVATVPWAVRFPGSEPGVPPEEVLPRHPSQLYAAFLEGFVLLVYTQVRFWKSDPKKTPPGQIAGEFLIGYAVLRIVAEIYREPDAALILGLSRGTFYSLALLLAAVALLVYVRSQQRRAVLEK